MSAHMKIFYLEIFKVEYKIKMNMQCKIYLSSPSKSPCIWPYNVEIIDENSFTLKASKGGIKVFHRALEMRVSVRRSTGASSVFVCLCSYLHLKGKCML